MDSITRNCLSLPSGRTLCYAVYGSPTPSTTILYFHGFMSSRLEPAGLEALALSMGVRFIAPDRPGYGGSTHDPLRTLETMAEDCGHLLDTLLQPDEKVIFMGASGGAPYAVMCASKLSHRASRLLLNVPFFPVAGRDDLLVEMSSASQRIILGARTSPLKTKFLLHVMRIVQRIPMNKHGLLRMGGFAQIDIETQMAYPEKGKIIKMASREGNRRGIAGAFRDLHLMGTMPLPTELLRSVTCPANVWCGVLDKTTPMAMAKLYAEELPQAELVMVPDLGHFLGYKHMPDILASAGLVKLVM